MVTSIPTIDSWALSASAASIGRFPALDDLTLLVAQNDVLKGALLLAILWWLWAQPGPDLEQRREIVIGTLLAAIAAAAVSRGIAVLVPFRDRPINTSGIGIPIDPRLVGWERGHGSFPSDHAALGFALATGIFRARRAVGVVAIVWVALVVSLPRVYLGIHWLTDILGGAILGASVAWLLTRPASRARLARPIRVAFERYPGLCYAGLFLFSYGIMTRFEHVRDLGKWAAHALRGGKFPRIGP
jgi:membrane-associated phospholipid phosphatase